MKKLQFKRIGILISFTLLISIGVQVWRNITLFRQIETQLVSDIQLSLDNALDAYYADIAKTDMVTFTNVVNFSHSTEMTTPGNGSGYQANKGRLIVTSLKSDSIADTADYLKQEEKGRLLFGSIEDLKKGLPSPAFLDSIGLDTQAFGSVDSLRILRPERISNLNIYRRKNEMDSSGQLKMLNKIIISITRDSLDFAKINTLLQEELSRKNISITYGLLHLDRDSMMGGFNQEQVGKMPFKTVSKSTFLPSGQQLELYFENTALNVLKRGLVETLTSLLFLSIIIGTFIYLYQIIKNQKEIAEIKEDLIGNITHEFKTPIATTLSAIEGIELFNPTNDPGKNKKYLGISKTQLHKLNQMVEKLLETASLDSEQLLIQREQIHPEPILRQLVQKYRVLSPEKDVELLVPAIIQPISADPFHFENTLSNLLDNAIKYGGKKIKLSLDQDGATRIRVWDNGGNIAKTQRNLVFEQFYRIPQGNIHEVKGFGIGLYYVKKIIEKHGGKIELTVGQQSTTFSTLWP